MTPDRHSQPLTYDPTTDTYTLFPTAGETVSTMAIIAVAEVAGVDPLELDPVYDELDPTLIDHLYAAQIDESIEIDGEVAVTIADHRVRIEPDGCLVVEPPN